MNKPYVFMDESYQDLYSLSQAYIKHFNEGMNDIYANAKELIKFIKSRFNNKAKVKKYVDILQETKYKSNALTFMIFEMTEHKEIYIAGVKMDLLSYLQALRENPDPANNILYGFLEDGGISKTFSIAGEDPKLCKHSLAIERNYRNPFTFKYLTNYYGYESKESLEGKVKSITINGEECFRRFSKLASQENFLITLAHKVGFTDTIVAVKDISPVFQSLKLLKKEVEEEQLRKVVDKSYFWWMLEDENYNKYDYKGKALKILKEYQDIKKEYDHYQTLIRMKKISSISFDNYIDISHELYDNYLCFVSAYHNDLITVKKKFDPEQYAPDRAYNKTYICPAFMAGKVCKLYNPEAPASTRINPLTGDIVEDIEVTDALDDVSLDKPLLVLPKEEDLFLDTQIQRRQLNKQYGFAFLSLFLGLAAVFAAFLVILVPKVLHGMLHLGFATSLDPNYLAITKGFTIYIVFAVFVVVSILSIVTMKGINMSKHYLNQYERLITHAELNDFLEEEKILYTEEKDKLAKQSFKNYGIISAITEVLLGVLCAFLALFIVATLTVKLHMFGSFTSMAADLGCYYTLAYGALFGLVCGLLVSHKSKLKLIIFAVLAIITSIVFILVL